MRGEAWIESSVRAFGLPSPEGGVLHDVKVSQNDSIVENENACLDHLGNREGYCLW